MIPPEQLHFDTEVREAIREVVALRRLSKTAHIITTRAQNDILRKLSPEALTRVAVVLAELEGAE